MALREVEIGNLTLEIPGLWKNPRTFTGMDTNSITELGGDIKVRGIRNPLTVQRVRVKEGGDVIELVLDGQRRILASSKAGYKKDDKIVVVDHTDEVIDLDAKTAGKLLIDVMASGHFREGLSTYEQAEAAASLKASGAGGAAIGAAIGRSESWVSRFLKALSAATPELLADWKKGKITDEQFKDLAEVKKDKQQEALAEVTQVRANGKSTNREAKADARARTKELAHAAKVEKKAAKPSKPSKKAKPVHASTPRMALAELIALADKRAPHDPYVKGIVDGVRYAVGEIGPDKFGKPWRVYLARVEGSSKPSSGPKEKAPKAKKISKKEQRKRDRDQVKAAKKKVKR